MYKKKTTPCKLRGNDLNSREGGFKALYLATHNGFDVPELVVQCASGSCRHHIWLNVNLALKSVSHCVRGYNDNGTVSLPVLPVLSSCDGRDALINT